MPLVAQSLTDTSTDKEIQAAISASIAKCVEEGRPQDQCAAIAYRYAEEATGKTLGNKGVQQKTVNVTGR